MLASVVTYVDKVPKMTLAFVAVKHHSWFLEISLKLGAGFVQRVVTVQKLDHEDAKVLPVLRLYRHRDPLDSFSRR